VTQLLSKKDILEGLRLLDANARANNHVVELSIYGGAALSLAFDMRQSTRDVDAVVNGAPDFLRSAVAEVAREKGWPEDWLNDGVKGFRSGNERMVLMESFQGGAEGGLRVSLPAPEYLFAMKCMAMRPEGIEGSHDISDIEALAHICGFKTADEALNVIEEFYPQHLVPAKVRFGVQEIMERIAAGAKMAQTKPPSISGGILSSSVESAPSTSTNGSRRNSGPK
jgi:hypothetical protein